MKVIPSHGLSNESSTGSTYFFRFFALNAAFLLVHKPLEIKVNVIKTIKGLSSRISLVPFHLEYIDSNFRKITAIVHDDPSLIVA